jgi:hypothetical protein
MRMRVCLCCLAMISLLGGCAAIGPPRVERDRIEYNSSITESWKRQILLNVAKIRYVEPIFFLDVGEIVASYSMETGGTVGASRTAYDFSGTSDSSLFELEGSAKYTDRPTITYRPLTGTPFFLGIMSPVPLKNILASIESGASAEFVLTLGVRSINGFRNEALTANGFKEADPEFDRIVELLTELQALNALHIVRDPDRKPGAPPCLLLKLTARKAGAKVAALRKELQDLLGFDHDRDEYVIGFGSTVINKNTIMLQTYSLAQMLASIAGRMEVPEEDLASHKAVPGRDIGNKGLFDQVMVHTAATRPKDAFVAVEYRNNWFWVDDHDLLTKRVFSFIMLAVTLMDKGGPDTQLQLTVPTQ